VEDPQIFAAEPLGQLIVSWFWQQTYWRHASMTPFGEGGWFCPRARLFNPLHVQKFLQHSPLTQRIQDQRFKALTKTRNKSAIQRKALIVTTVFVTRHAGSPDLVLKTRDVIPPSNNGWRALAANREKEQKASGIPCKAA
jgi:hypothetical protein